MPVHGVLCATTARKGGRDVAANWKQPCCTRDEGRSLGVGMQVQAPNCPELLWSRAMVVSVAGKGAA